MSTNTIRKTITMDSAKTQFLTRAVNAHTPESEALKALAGEGTKLSSESAVINELIELGIAKVKEEAALTGYAALAAEQADSEARAFERIARRNSRRALARP